MAVFVTATLGCKISFSTVQWLSPASSTSASRGSDPGTTVQSSPYEAVLVSMDGTSVTTKAVAGTSTSRANRTLPSLPVVASWQAGSGACLPGTQTVKVYPASLGSSTSSPPARSASPSPSTSICLVTFSVARMAAALNGRALSALIHFQSKLPGLNGAPSATTPPVVSVQVPSRVPLTVRKMMYTLSPSAQLIRAFSMGTSEGSV